MQYIKLLSGYKIACCYRLFTFLLFSLCWHVGYAQGSGAPVISYTSPSSLLVGTAVSLSPVNTGGAVTGGQSTSTFAGSGSSGFINGTGTSASFYNPLSTAVDGSGNVYVADAGNHCIRKISPLGVVTTFAGSGFPGYADGTGTTASFQHPSFLTVDASGNVFVSDQQNHRIRKITPAGVVSTFAGSGSMGSADGTGTAASFQHPIGLAFDATGNLYVADYYNQKIRKITSSGVVSTFAGTGVIGSANGAASLSTFKYPMGLAFDGSGNLYVADRSNNLVRKISSAGAVTTIAGNGTIGSTNSTTGTLASFNNVNALTVDGLGNLYVADHLNNMIRKVSPLGAVSTLAGTTTAGTVNGSGSVVRFNSPYGISRDAQDNLYVAENAANVIRKTVLIKGYTINPALPAGLSINETTGVISGTPTAVSSATTYTITASNYSGSNTTTLSIGVTAAIVPVTAVAGNYIITYSPRISGLTTESAVSATSSDKLKVQTSIQYFDGLGRSTQTIMVKGNGDGTKDLVQPVAYDAFGRETTKYLPYTTSTGVAGSYRADALKGSNGYSNSAQKTFYQTPAAGIVATPNPYSVTVIEASPLNRVLEQGAPGSVWQPAATRTIGANATGRTSAMAYDINIANEVKLWTITPTGGASTTTSYPANKLYKTISKDENWVSGKAGTAEEFTDFEGKVILKRIWETEAISLSTYYIYDDFGNLRYVVPPAVIASSFTEATTDLPFNQYIYAYHYDGRKRLTEKKIPGKGWEYLVYNKRDQLVMSQDAVQRGKPNQDWTVSKYDVLGRLIITGIYAHTGSVAGTSYRLAIQTLVDAQSSQWENKTTTGIGYTTNLTYPAIALNTTLSVQYYDDYTAPGMPAAYNQSTNVAYSKMTKGMPTASQLNVLGSTAMLWSVNYYDDEGRVIKTYKQHYQSGSVLPANYDEVTNTYSFTGELLTSKREHRVGATTTTIANSYEYDHMGRKKLVKEKINTGAEVVLSKLSYNEIGQLLKKELHSTDNGTTFLQKTEYAYNERGWLKTGTSNEFSIKLKYQDGTTPQYNGNISNQDWGAGSTFPNVYTYGYDKLNRLSTAASTGVKMSEALTYDVMGNIKSMNRDAAAAASIYNYTGNQLNNITLGALATAANYVYDVNGNATKDGRNGVILTYNLLNLPATAIKTTPVPAVNLTYTYDATGNKLRKVSSVAPIATRHYVDGIEYNGNLIDVIHTEEGLARNNAGVYSYEYNLTDHLGNVRYSFNKHPTTLALQRLQVDDYYAFGLRKNSVAASNDNKYLYNGKELQEELGQLDYGFRFYDPVIGRWNVVDPLAEDYDDVSPYNYVLNNPSNFTDPDGAWVNEGPLNFASTIVDAKGKIIDYKDDGDNSVYQLINNQKFKIGTEKEGIDYSKLIGQTLNPFVYDPNPIDLKELVVTAKKKPNSAWAAIGLGLALRTAPAWTADGLDPEPVTKTIGAIAISIYSAYVIGEEAIKYYYENGKREQLYERIIMSQGRGERGQTGSAAGTNNPFKKLKPDPKKPGNVLEKDANGQSRTKRAPDGFAEWWNTKHPDKKI